MLLLPWKIKFLVGFEQNILYLLNKCYWFLHKTFLLAILIQQEKPMFLFILSATCTAFVAPGNLNTTSSEEANNIRAQFWGRWSS